MPRFVVRPAGSNILKVIETTTQEENQARMVQYLSEDPGIQLFRIAPQGNGDFLLRRLRVRPGSETFEQKIVSVDFEDNI